MHSFTAPAGTTFHHSPDLSGDVIISKPDDETVAHVPGEDLLAFALHHLRREMIANVEQMTDDSLIGYLTLGL